MNSCVSVKKEKFDFSYEWNYIVSEIEKVFKLSKSEAQSFGRCNTAKIIAMIPFAAGCLEPERTAIAHLCLYIAEIKGFQKYYAHLPSDDTDIYKRLTFISNFCGGDKTVIDHGMNILAFIMLNGYKNSEEEDRINNVYNPLVSGSWNYEEINNKLKREIEKMTVPDIDNIVFYESIPWSH